MKILGISGSLRKESFNTRLLELARSCLPAEVDFLVHTCDSLPLYNQELDGPEKPVAVNELLELIANADGLLIATPEYNYGIPGVLKNAVDWASRPAFKSVLKDRPTAILSASPSQVGGVRAQQQLKMVLGSTLTPIFPAPDFCVPFVHQVFSAEDSQDLLKLSERLNRYLHDFIFWIKNR